MLFTVFQDSPCICQKPYVELRDSELLTNLQVLLLESLQNEFVILKSVLYRNSWSDYTNFVFVLFFDTGVLCVTLEVLELAL